MVKTQSPVTYQGGKQRLAAHIVDAMQVTAGVPFHDICCGSGAVSIEMVSRGHSPYDINMVDAGPWGVVWSAVGSGTFDMSRFRHYCAQVPKRKELIKAFMEELSRQNALVDTPYVYLLLQAASFGGKALWFTDTGKWENVSFRGYWQPTATSRRRTPVNPMMPMPDTIIERMDVVCERMLGVHGFCVDATQYMPTAGVVYVDPPYAGTTQYGDTFDAERFAKATPLPCFVSEGRPLPGASEALCLSIGRAKGGISGERSVANAEWLSRFNSEEAKAA